MSRIAIVIALLVVSCGSAMAQPWGWDDDSGPRYRGGYGGYGYPRWSPWGYDQPRPRQQTWRSPWDEPEDRWRDWDESPEVVDGGSRPEIRPITPEKVPFPSQYAQGSIIIDTHAKQLFLVLSSAEAYRYPISVGRVGFSWTGTEKISRIADWPDWYPPEEMRERDPKLPKKMTGGLRNPLGAKALYLGNTLYRIHGTNDAKTIGQAASSGCFRMLNGHVIDLAGRVAVNTPVTVVDRLPAEVARGVPPLSRTPTAPAEEARARRW
jgi:hypothetical protein